MAQSTFEISLSDPDETAGLAAALASCVVPGDVILLSGDLGAGKTHFARALIRSILAEPEDVPSPSFTLVQTYETPRGMVWHSDLYRITNVEEVEELGLFQAFEEAICLVEWPDRLADLTPQDALTLSLSYGPSESERVLAANWSDPKWAERLAPWRA